MQKYLWLIILAGIALAFIWPAPGILLGPALTYLLMLMMVLSCVNINLGELKKIRDGWWRYIVLTLFVFLLPTSIVPKSPFPFIFSTTLAAFTVPVLMAS